MATKTEAIAQYYIYFACFRYVWHEVNAWVDYFV